MGLDDGVGFGLGLRYVVSARWVVVEILCVVVDGVGVGRVLGAVGVLGRVLSGVVRSFFVFFWSGAGTLLVVLLLFEPVVGGLPDSDVPEAGGGGIPPAAGEGLGVGGEGCDSDIVDIFFFGTCWFGGTFETYFGLMSPLDECFLVVG